MLAVSVITQMELLVGCRNKAELRNTERFLQRFQVLKVSELVCDIALELLRADFRGRRDRSFWISGGRWTRYGWSNGLGGLAKRLSRQC